MSYSCFTTLTSAWIALAIILFPLLIKVKAPYGRHSSKRWGPVVDNRTAWIIMELPSLVLFITLFLTGGPVTQEIKWVFFSVWVLHYINRVFIFPARTRTRGKKMPLLIMTFAMLFNLVNAFLNGYWLGYTDRLQQSFSGQAWSIGQGAWGKSPELYYQDWFTDPRFIIGIFLFVAGFVINQLADNHLIRLRNKKVGGYYIPTHRLYNRVSCPNFGGEILEWTGFAIMTCSLPGLSFAVWTAVNLIPRALHHHQWYQETFPDYPKNRKAIIPGIL